MEDFELGFTILIIIFGMIGNVALLYAISKNWNTRKSPDKLLLGNLGIVGLANMIYSVVLLSRRDRSRDRTTWSKRRIDSDNTPDRIKNFALLGALLYQIISSSTLLVLVLNRYDILTKFNHQRWMNCCRAIGVICLLWAFALITILPMHFHAEYQTHFISFSIAWLVFCAVSSSVCLLFTERCIRKHHERAGQMFGTRQRRVQSRLTRSIVGLSLCFAFFSIPELIFLYRTLASEVPFFGSTWVKMALRIASQFIRGIVIPVACFIVDYRLRGAFRTNPPSSMVQQNGLSIPGVTNNASRIPRAIRHLLSTGNESHNTFSSDTLNSNSNVNSTNKNNDDENNNNDYRNNSNNNNNSSDDSSSNNNGNMDRNHNNNDINNNNRNNNDSNNNNNDNNNSNNYNNNNYDHNNNNNNDDYNANSNDNNNGNDISNDKDNDNENNNDNSDPSNNNDYDTDNNNDFNAKCNNIDKEESDSIVTEL